MKNPVTRSILMLCVLTLISTLIVLVSPSTTIETTDTHINSDATGEWYAELVSVDIGDWDDGFIITYPRRSIHITEDHGRINTGNIFLVEYKVSLPLNLTLNLGNISIGQTFTKDMLGFLEGTYSNYYEKDGCMIAIVLNDTHIRLKVNTTHVGELRWNIKMYDEVWVHKEILGTMIFDKILITYAGILSPDDCDDQYAWGGTFNFTFRWNPETDRWESVP